MKEAGRAVRRHEEQRIKKNRARHQLVVGGLEQTKPSERIVGIHAHTAAPCSCWMCGNPRKFFNERTLQERSFIEVSREYLMQDAA